MNSHLMADLARWERGELAFDELSERHPDSPAGELAEMHVWVSLMAADEVAEPGPDFPELAVRLGDHGSDETVDTGDQSDAVGTGVTEEVAGVAPVGREPVGVAAPTHTGERVPAELYEVPRVPLRRLVAAVFAAALLSSASASMVDLTPVARAVDYVTRPIHEVLNPVRSFGDGISVVTPAEHSPEDRTELTNTPASEPPHASVPDGNADAGGPATGESEFGGHEGPQPRQSERARSAIDPQPTTSTPATPPAPSRDSSAPRAEDTVGDGGEPGDPVPRDPSEVAPQTPRVPDVGAPGHNDGSNQSRVPDLRPERKSVPEPRVGPHGGDVPSVRGAATVKLTGGGQQGVESSASRTARDQIGPRAPSLDRASEATGGSGPLARTKAPVRGGR